MPLIICLLVFLTACTSNLSEISCAAMDWQALGFKEGLSGKEPRLDKEVKNCNKYNIPVDVEAYKYGWERGIKSYCAPDIGYKLGIQGKNYPYYCPKDYLPNIIATWKQGIRIFCTDLEAFNLGKKGVKMPTLCPVDLADSFSYHYSRGLSIYKKIQSIKKELKSLENGICYKEKLQHVLEHSAYYEKNRLIANKNKITLLGEEICQHQQKISELNRKLRILEKTNN